MSRTKFCKTVETELSEEYVKHILPKIILYNHYMLVLNYIRFFPRPCPQQRQNLQVNLSALQADYDNLNHRLEEETESNNSLRDKLSKVNAEYTALKTRFDKEIQAKTEECEEIRWVIALPKELPKL